MLRNCCAALLALFCSAALRAGDDELLPPNLPQAQRDNLMGFLKAHAKPDRFVPAGAKVVGTLPGGGEPKADAPPNTPVKQYTVQVTPHRPVPGREDDHRVDVYYYRPNPEKGKPGITVKYTVDTATGKQVGDTEVLLNHHTPIAREELAEAVAMAKEKSDAVKKLYQADEKDVRWEYLQMLISRKSDQHEPGDRVVRLVFFAGNDAVPVIVNLTKGVVTPATK